MDDGCTCWIIHISPTWDVPIQYMIVDSRRSDSPFFLWDFKLSSLVCAAVRACTGFVRVLIGVFLAFRRALC